jgi:hypothetical protein
MTGGTQAVPLDAATVASYDAALIAADHDVIAYMALVGAAKLVADTAQRLCPRGRGRRQRRQGPTGDGTIPTQR